MTENQKIELAVEKWKERAGEIKQPELGTQIQLPLWNEFSRGIPNPLTRSSLFAPIARGRRKVHKRTEMASRSDYQIFYSGEQLDEADRDVFLQILHESRKVPLGKPIYINRARFLREIGRAKSSSSYDWLNGALERLFMGALFIRTKRYTIGGKSTTTEHWMHLINGAQVDHDKDSDELYLYIDSRIAAMFDNKEYTLLDWEKRKLIEKKVDMAKWLQCLISSNEKGTQRYGLDDLKKWMDYEGRIRDFKKAILEASQELERLEVVAEPKIELSTRGVEQLTVKRL